MNWKETYGIRETRFIRAAASREDGYFQLHLYRQPEFPATYKTVRDNYLSGMIGEWKVYRIRELGKVVTGTTPSSKHPEDFGDEVPFATPSDYKNYNKWLLKTDRYLSHFGAAKLQSRIIPPNSVLVTCIGSDMGKIAMNKTHIVSNQQINAIIPNQNVIPDYLYYKLLASHETLRMYGEAGTAVPIVNKGDFENIELNVPRSKSEQRAIASILSSLDDKIDLLHRQNKTLEQLAETLFRQWFVEEAEESWEVGYLSDYVQHVKKSIVPNKYPEQPFFHYSIPAFDEGMEPKLELGLDILSNKYQVFEDTILVSKLNPRFPRIWQLRGRSISEHSICSTEFQVIRPLQDDMYEFVYYFLKSSEVTQKLSGAASGTSGSHQRINPDDILNLEFKVPLAKKIHAFHLSAFDFLSKINYNFVQIRTLTQLRDTLLPKLMSGELRVQVNGDDPAL